MWLVRWESQDDPRVVSVQTTFSSEALARRHGYRSTPAEALAAERDYCLALAQDYVRRAEAVERLIGEPPERMALLDGLTGEARVEAAHNAAIDCGRPSCSWCRPEKGEA